VNRLRPPPSKATTTRRPTSSARPRALLARAEQLRDQAAQNASALISYAIGHDGLTDGFWDHVTNFIDEHAGLLSAISQVEKAAAALIERQFRGPTAELRSGRAVRVRRFDPPITTLDLHIPVPGGSAWLLPSFSTPLVPLADALVGLFDAIAGTLRWTS
jgi:hypothetical protein